MHWFAMWCLVPGFDTIQIGIPQMRVSINLLGTDQVLSFSEQQIWVSEVKSSLASWLQFDPSFSTMDQSNLQMSLAIREGLQSRSFDFGVLFFQYLGQSGSQCAWSESQEFLDNSAVIVCPRWSRYHYSRSIWDHSSTTLAYHPNWLPFFDEDLISPLSYHISVGQLSHQKEPGISRKKKRNSPKTNKTFIQVEGDTCDYAIDRSYTNDQLLNVRSPLGYINRILQVLRPICVIIPIKVPLRETLPADFFQLPDFNRLHNYTWLNENHISKMNQKLNVRVGWQM